MRFDYIDGDIRVRAVSRSPHGDLLLRRMADELRRETRYPVKLKGEAHSSDYPEDVPETKPPERPDDTRERRRRK